MEDSNYESGREREYTEEEVMAILDSLPAGMFSKIISKRFEAPVSFIFLFEFLVERLIFL